MEFTANQHQPFKRMSRLGVVALLHVVVLAVVLNDMKIKITLPTPEPMVLKNFKAEPEKKIPETIPEFDHKLPPPPTTTIDIPKNEVTTPPTKDQSGVTSKETDGPINVGTKTTVTGNDPGPLTPPTPARTPQHVAAVIDVNACDKPAYPASSVRLGETGVVALSMLVGTDGRVVETRTDSSSGSRALDRAASQALSLCRFKPGTIDGVPQQSWTKVQYVWKLD